MDHEASEQPSIVDAKRVAMDEVDAEAATVLMTRWREVGLEATHLIEHHDGTVHVDSGERSTLDRPIRPGGSEVPVLVGYDLDNRRLLGRGGEGYVHEVKQIAIQRDVAVKTSRRREDNEDHRGEDGPKARADLILEGRILGNLEHPNIVPVHAIGRSDDGQVALVMKRIEGRVWQDFVGVNGRLTAPEGTEGDPLVWHLNVLRQVATAAHFAHVRGILHRDIKLQNVMIGPFDEVYLMDWGIAVGLVEHPHLGLPKVNTRPNVQGTPAYMAPEMIVPRREVPVGVHSDVFLLGACLHVLLTGRGRHNGKNVVHALRLGLEVKPFEYGNDVPRELAAIANRATAANPDHRFATAEEFRRAIERYLDHRGAQALAEDALSKLRRLRQLRKEGATGRDVDDLVGACRFGFAQALAQWPQCPTAVVGKRRLALLICDLELSLGDVDRAEAAIIDIDEVPSTLLDAIVRARASTERRVEEFDRLREVDRRANKSIAADARTRVYAGIGTFFGFYYFLLGFLARREIYVAEHGFLIFSCAGYGVMLALFAKFFGKQLAETVVNQRFFGFLILSSVGSTAFWVYADATHLSFTTSLALIQLIYFHVTCGLALAVDRQLWPSTVFFLIGFAGTGFFPAYRYEWIGAAIGLSLNVGARQWAKWDRTAQKSARPPR